MTKREAVIETLNHRGHELIPYHLDFTQQALEQLIAHTGDPKIEEKLGAYLNYIQYWGWPTEQPDNPGHFKDEFGVVWNRTGADRDIGVVDQPQIEDLEDYHYEFPQFDEKRLRAEYEALVANKGDRFTMAGFGFCMFERSWSLMGMENVLMSMVACPDELDDLFDRICDYYMPMLDIALEYDIDGVYFGDDWGQQHGLIMGPEHWRHFIKPRMARLYDKVKSKGKFVMQHSCGDCHEIFPDLIEIGLDCYQTFQPEVYDIAKMKEMYGDKLSFWGGVSTQQCLPYATPEAVKAETIRVMKTLRKDGGLIIAPTHALAFDVPPENILAMVDVFQHQEKYL
ncbi:uroporphyrinogen decarboxylase family protein [Hydrogenoanaerobacterium sp.]|uniref:uroporphyrinogen decarboxylase family protein n=1 Tax=Hydrogenoanaerobacterium sp. TaxID=2953763 RepID=UPI002898D524|nr:uroporphyrinogen decarboxylase family protein [Hydrogenoanaerobacterium sp.]